MGYCVAPTGLGDGWWCDPQDLRPGLASVRPYGAFGSGLLGLSGSALSWVVVGGWLARGEILRVAQNDKGDGGGGGNIVVCVNI